MGPGGFEPRLPLAAGASTRSAEKRSWTKRTTIAPSPTAVARRLTDPERTSPIAKTLGMLVSRMPSAPALAPADEAVVVERDRAADQSVCGGGDRCSNRFAPKTLATLSFQVSALMG